MEKEDINEEEKKTIVKDEIEKACKNEEQKKFIPFGYLATAPTLSSTSLLLDDKGEIKSNIPQF
tara:strand:- start:214 stop:405 length:192 start_codon:yes stop_codon:yes gene_type:complete